MEQSLFTALCDIADEFDRLARDLEPGPVQDRLRTLLQRLDTVIDRTVGLAQVHLPAAE